jgi:hypothetical protein
MGEEKTRDEIDAALIAFSSHDCPKRLTTEQLRSILAAAMERR